MRITISLSTHRLETLSRSAGLWKDHEVIILEEPPSQEFRDMLAGRFAIDDYIALLDHEYPLFAQSQYQLLRGRAAMGAVILQSEPFIQGLLGIHEFFAAGNGPADITAGTIEHRIYKAEHEATRCLIDYYQAAAENDFQTLITTLLAFVRTDCARFRLRDELRAEEIISLLQPGKSTFVEAGGMHLLLPRYLEANLPDGWEMSVHSIEQELLDTLGLGWDGFSPGDELTARYFDRVQPNREAETLLAAQAIVFTKVITKGEVDEPADTIPHLSHEYRANRLVRSLDVAQCRDIYEQITLLPSSEAFAHAVAMSAK
ncbi:MAG: hypothetical protein N839_0006295 [Desulfofustis sp. PB-SRB1]|jgi:hypothetical protein|nr:hypothetical protein [Desulfofustis sp. PB-SRB1]MBM1002009.1 hypothetical protein [Desulfofustis sp. PB-SRB1]HBH27608.1 hypothetical protein [Desulfofustis sp.]HBH32848.1 hypothetical protein [Desulfofustis sp.]